LALYPMCLRRYDTCALAAQLLDGAGIVAKSSAALGVLPDHHFAVIATPEDRHMEHKTVEAASVGCRRAAAG
jgi:hypothetical protein